ncbi:MAG: CGNR zinc finger domain-containing protein [Thalassobaculaceae bacterium]|nr:CGNR zinc finger domain-containing protein [Thalassobaculaceae bacterium]
MKVVKKSDDPLLDGYYTGAGATCLDYVNTVDWRTSDHPAEFLASGAATDAWLAFALDHPPLRLDTDAVADLCRFREALYRLIVGAPQAGDLDLLNAALSAVGDRGRLVAGSDGYSWAAEATATGLAVLKAALARSAADLLVDSARLARVKECHGHGCGWLFVDESRAGNRRWCSMQTCGNREKARAHYRRTRSQT